MAVVRRVDPHGSGGRIAADRAADRGVIADMHRSGRSKPPQRMGCKLLYHMVL
jgi:hypothetical protein